MVVAARLTGEAPSHHTVYFSRDYRAEFDALFGRRRLPDEPTIYVCAADRDGTGTRAGSGPERLFVLVNAPADAGDAPLSAEELSRCETTTFERLKRLGLTVERVDGR